MGLSVQERFASEEGGSEALQKKEALRRFRRRRL
jgi:hypothetical protein